ncbi:MAG: undecaprenyl-phosphate glucose phosphotransferase [Phocaeicola sp.]|nr:undecaprenyl-phosphate glucose phosphotransferase [Phocaeicola sp.]
MKQPTTENSDIIKLVAIAGDFALLNLTMVLVFFLLKEIAPQVAASISLKTYLLTSNLCYIPCISIFGVILHNRIVRPEQIVGRLLGTISLHVVILLTVLAIIKVDHISHTYLMLFYLSFISFIIGWRLTLRFFVKMYRRSGRNQRITVLIGDGDNMVELYHTLNDLTYGYKVAGVFHDQDSTDYPEGIPFKGGVEQMFNWLSHNTIHELYCGLPSSRKDDILAIMDYCENNLIRFYSVPHVRNYIKRQLQLELLGEVPVLSIRTEPLQNPFNRLAKRLFDLVCSSLFLLTVFPFMYLIVGLIIKFTSPGPIFFKQERNGENGKIFKCYKFRSMKVNALSDTLQATKNDPRKTRFGNFLRKSNLDEMPQFINVFKGEMSIVGPRPHMLKHTEEYSQLINKYMMRHLVKPGITGWAQVTGFRGETKELSQMEGRVRRDLWYIENWTFLLDIRIMIKTVTNMFHGEKNAY